MLVFTWPIRGSSLRHSLAAEQVLRHPRAPFIAPFSFSAASHACAKKASASQLPTNVLLRVSDIECFHDLLSKELGLCLLNHLHVLYTTKPVRTSLLVR